MTTTKVKKLKDRPRYKLILEYEKEFKDQFVKGLGKALKEIQDKLK